MPPSPAVAGNVNFRFPPDLKNIDGPTILSPGRCHVHFRSACLISAGSRIPYATPCGEHSRAMRQVIVTQAAVKGRRRDAEHLGGLAAVPARLFQRGDDLLALNLA